MIDFNFYSPTKLFFGLDKEKQIGHICNDFGFKKVLIVIGKGSVKKTGLYDLVIEELNKNGIQHELIEGVRPNPTIEVCHEGIELARSFAPDMILAIGGGSVIDTAKNISVGYYYSGDSFDFNLHKVVPTKAIPVGVILTISASGSEMSNSCVIQDDKTGVKKGFNCDLLRPLFAIEDPKLTYSVNEYQTACGIVDIMMHTMERYFIQSCDNELADGFAEALLRSVIKAGAKAFVEPNDYESRAVLMLASSFSHNGLTSVGKKNFLTVHQLEHALSGMYPNIAHGAGLAVLFPAWMKYYSSLDVDKFDKFARNVFGINGPSREENAKKGIMELEKFFTSIKMPKNYKDLGIEEPDIEGLVSLTTNNGTRVIDHHIKPLDGNVAREIFNLCY